MGSRIGAFAPDDVVREYQDRSNALLDRFPGLRGKLPWLPLGTYPTPVEKFAGSGCGAAALWVKRDDLTSPLYGGNKTRKLEHVLAAARLAGRTSIVTLGGLGSHQCLATALHGRRLGFQVDIALFDQPITEHVVEHLLADQEAGARFIYGGSFLGAAARAFRAYHQRPAPYYIPAGASVPLGTIGYVGAALELAAQVRAGLLPTPTRVFVPAASCGTAGGLLLGFKLAELETRITAVRVAPAISANAYHVASSARAALALLRSLDATIPEFDFAASDLDLETDFYGRGYGRSTDEAAAAIRTAAPQLSLEISYSGKTLAACLAHCRTASAGAPILFWNTCSSAPLHRAPSITALPQNLRKLLSKSGF